jgi:hypothetical protein
VVLGVLVNILVARHYKRWDWTRAGLFTLSEATTETLHALEEPVQVYVLLNGGGSADDGGAAPARVATAGRRRGSRWSFTDPDRRPAAFLAVQQRFGIVGGQDRGREDRHGRGHRRGAQERAALHHAARSGGGGRRRTSSGGGHASSRR